MHLSAHEIRQVRINAWKIDFEVKGTKDSRMAINNLEAVW